MLSFQSGERQTREGLLYHYHYKRRYKNSPPLLTLKVHCPSGGDFRVTIEKDPDRLAKRIGLSVELQTGDHEFDHTYYLSSDSERFCSAYFGDPARREAVARIFRAGFTELQHDGKDMIAIWKNFHEGDLPSCDQMVRALHELAQNPPFNPALSLSLSGREKRHLAWTGVIALCALGAFVFAAAERIWPPLSDRQAFYCSLNFSIPLFCLLCWIEISFLRGRSSSHRELAALLPLTCAGVLMAGMGLTVFVNGRFDRSPRTSHSLVVSNKYTTQPKRRIYYHITVPAWVRGRANESFKVSARTYERLVPGQSRVQLVSGRGRLGLEWVASKDFD